MLQPSRRINNKVKKCNKCGVTHPFNFFYQSFRDGLHNQCKKCESGVAKQYRLHHKKEIASYAKKYAQTHKKKLKKYRLTREIKIQKYRNSITGRDTYSNREFKVSISNMLEWQNYKCAICQKPEDNKKLHVDHNHKTGQIRMLLCHGCNIGYKLTDNIELLLIKVEYLKSFELLGSV